LQVDEPLKDAKVVKLPTAAKPMSNAKKEPQRNMYAAVSCLVSVATVIYS